MNKLLKTVLALLAALSLMGPAAAAGGGVAWDLFPTAKLTDQAALQNGAKLFVNHCMGCHSASFVRYNRMQEIGLTDAQIKENLMFNADKVGETMRSNMDPKSGKAWFGAAPPDLTLVARSRASASMGSGSDYLYTFLRGYFRDAGKDTGWDNVAYPATAMPNVFWEQQGERRPVFDKIVDSHDPKKEKMLSVFKGWEQVRAGHLSPREFDSQIGDLVAFMTWAAEPQAQSRVRLGVWVLLALALLSVLAWRLNAAYWKDVK
jgi:ubiquinol-cytochrome c reductase cytochrome c1 subunit